MQAGLDRLVWPDNFRRMAAATLTRARALVFRLAPNEQVELASAIVHRVSGLRASSPHKKLTKSVGRNVSHLARAIGSPLTGKILDARLEGAVSGREKGVSASAAVKHVRKRLGL